jgi:signal transduction histidine kinase
VNGQRVEKGEVTALRRRVAELEFQLLRAGEERSKLLAENQFRGAELDSVISSLAEGVIVLGPGREIIQMNPAAGEILGHPHGKQLRSLEESMTLLRVERPGGGPFPLEETPAARALSGETVRGVAMVLHHPDGRTLWLRVSAIPIHAEDGRVLGAVTTFVDTTQLRDLQEQGEELVRAISHDLRTPLTSIQGYAQLLQRMLVDLEEESRVAVSIQHVIAAARRMNAMIQDLVDSARMESGQMAVHTQPVDLRSLVKVLLEEAGEAVERERIRVEIPQQLGLVKADPLGLGRVLTNLLTNALNYSAPGTTVTLKAERTGDVVSVAVKDEGDGIPAEVLPRLFDRFYRMKEARYAQGLGLGLYITKKLVEAHGSDLVAESRPGEGSIFRFTLPAMEQDRRDEVTDA